MKINNLRKELSIHHNYGVSESCKTKTGLLIDFLEKKTKFKNFGIFPGLDENMEVLC